MAGRRRADLRAALQNLLCAEVTDLAEPAILQQRLDKVNAGLGSPSMRILHHRKIISMQEELAASRSGSAVSVGLTYSRIVVAGDHTHVDGHGLLDVLARLVDQPITAPETLPARSGTIRRTPAAHPRGTAEPLAFAHYRDDLFAEVFAAIKVPNDVHPARLVAALAGATTLYNARRQVGATPLRVVLSGRTPEGPALIRLPDIEAATATDVAGMISDVPREPIEQLSSARRHPPTLLVSPLGLIEAPTTVRSLEFYPTFGTGLGVSVGTSTHEGRTTITARAPESRYTPHGLAEFLELVRNSLARPRVRAFDPDA